MMSFENLKRQFAKIGAMLEVKVAPTVGQPLRWQPRSSQADFLFDVTQDKRGEQFALTVQENAVDKLEFLVIDLQPQQRHLLLLLKRLEAGTGRRKEKFLCGHDERHWFIAPVSGADSLIRVEEAFEALKPAAALRSQQRHAVRSKDWNKRRNAGFVRQGEWFFVPQPEFQPD